MSIEIPVTIHFILFFILLACINELRLKWGLHCDLNVELNLTIFHVYVINYLQIIIYSRIWLSETSKSQLNSPA
jgi:hypothetical protein